MEAVATQSLSYAKFTKALSTCSTSSSISTSLLQCKTSLIALQSAKSLSFRTLSLQCIKPLVQRKLGIVCASDGASSVAQGWLLDPVGDGDWKHIGFKVAKPGAYEIFSSEMIVGREPEKANLVIPVATVSGSHARIQNKEGSLYVTDLDSTNGTYINEKRVPPGATAVVPPGSLLTFGDTHLAIFRVLKVEKTLENQAEESEDGSADDTDQPQTTS